MVKKIDSSDDLQIYKDDKHIKIYAGPGAGKTYLLVENIKKIIINSKKLKNSERKILCITYTNVAADEIKRRLGSYENYVVVLTTHAFINQYIIPLNQIQIKNIIKNDFDIEVDKHVKLATVQESGNILSGYKKEDIYEYLSREFHDVVESEYNTLSKTSLSSVEINIKIINSNRPLEVDVEKIKSNKKIPLSNTKLKNAIKSAILNVSGRLSFDEVLYFGYKIISEYPIALHMIRCEFPYIIVDEYQDTNPIQNKIIKMIAEKESVLAVIGDVAQSIYSFQGADYNEFNDFKMQSFLPIEEYVIEDNRRSSENIIHFINYLRIKDPNLKTQNCAKNLDINEKVNFIIQPNDQSLDSFWENIDSSKYAILCRRTTDVFMYIKGISREQKRILNEISNMYNYTFQGSLEAEITKQREAWIFSIQVIVKLRDAYERKCIPTMLRIMEKDLDLKNKYNIFSEENKKNLNDIVSFVTKVNLMIDENFLLNELIDKINVELDSYSFKVSNYLSYRSQDEEVSDSRQKLYELIGKIEFATAYKLVTEIFSEESKYMTIHGAKGMEFDDVIINISPFRKEDKIINSIDILCNPQIFSDDKSSLEIAEYVRIIYVAASRAKNKLYIHLFGNESDVERLRSSFESYCIEKEISHFFDIKFIE